MKPRHSAPTALLVALAIGGGASGVGADEKGKDRQKQHDTIHEALKRGEVLPLEKILVIAEQRVAGEIIEIELERSKEASVLIYEIKILTPTGRVREIKIDARDGTVLEIEDD